MSAEPPHLPHDHRLFDGRTVTIRPVQPEDAQRMQAFLKTLSDDNRYLRFHKWIGPPSDRLAGHLVTIDPDRELALVCIAGAGAEAGIVGDARYGVNADGASCEFGIMVADAWRNTGIAGLLMDDLIRAARGQGLKHMEGLVLSTNSAMLRFSRGLGFEIMAIPEDRTIMRISKAL